MPSHQETICVSLRPNKPVACKPHTFFWCFETSLANTDLRFSASPLLLAYCFLFTANYRCELLAASAVEVKMHPVIQVAYTCFLMSVVLKSYKDLIKTFLYSNTKKYYCGLKFPYTLVTKQWWDFSH